MVSVQSHVCKQGAKKPLLRTAAEAQYVAYVKTFLGETKDTCLHSPDREPMADQCMDTTKVQFDEPRSLIRVFTGIWVRGFLQKQK